MERNFYDTDFEDLIKEKADQYRMYPSEKVWKGIDRALRSRRKWYWTGFVLLLSGVSYLAVDELIKPDIPRRPEKPTVVQTNQPAPVGPAQLNPFVDQPIAGKATQTQDHYFQIPNVLIAGDEETSTATVIPLTTAETTPLSNIEAPSNSLVIAGIDPMTAQSFNLELVMPVLTTAQKDLMARTKSDDSDNILNPENLTVPVDENRINWLQEHAITKQSVRPLRHIQWQLAFSPTVNYRTMRGDKNAKLTSTSGNIPLALNIEGDINSLLNHKPALGFELGTHGLLSLSKRLTLKGGIQFNYSKYDIRAYKSPMELATISLNATTYPEPGTLTSYTDIRNFSGSSTEELKNQYFQLSLPIGLEFRLFGNDRIQFNVAGTVQPTYLLNANTYLITTDYKNYTKAPSLVRKWNMNAGVEAFLSYDRGGVKWQIGPQFRYQLLSSYKNVYPIKEYLMEYGIKVGVTKTIR